MKKPKGGCKNHGFTWMDDDGKFVQIAWKDMKARGEALYVYTRATNRWTRIRDSKDANKPGDPYASTLSYAIASIDATDQEIGQNATMLPNGFLTGTHTKTVQRLRELAKLDPLLVQASNLWFDLTFSETDALLHMWERPENTEQTPISDADILRQLRPNKSSHVYVVHGTDEQKLLTITATALETMGAGSEEERFVHGAPDAVRLLLKSIADGDLKHSHVDNVLAVFQTLVPASVDNPWEITGKLQETLNLLKEFSEDDDPAQKMLATLYKIPSRPMANMLLTVRLIDGTSITATDATDITNKILEIATSQKEQTVLTDIVVNRLQQTGGDIEQVLATINLYAESPMETLRQHGTVDNYLTAHHITLDSGRRKVIAETLKLPLTKTLDDTTLAMLDRVDPETFIETLGLLFGDVTLNPRTGVQRAVDHSVIKQVVTAVMTFGQKTPEWLLQTATSPEIDRVRQNKTLPDAETARKRIQTLETMLAADPLDETTQTRLTHTKEAYKTLLDGLRRRQVETLLATSEGDERDALETELAELATTMPEMTLETIRQTFLDDDQLLLELLPNVTRATKLSKECENSDIADTNGDTDHGGKMDMANTGRRLNEFAGALKQDDTVKALSIGRTLLTEPSWIAMLPAAKTLRNRIDTIEKQLGQTGNKKTLDTELALWKAYTEALLVGDISVIQRLGTSITATKPAKDVETKPPTLVSPHDSLYWLPADPKNTIAPDGTTLGEWLLTDGRGKSSLGSETGRRSLELAAEVFGQLGSKEATIRQLSDAKVSQQFENRGDALTAFFVRNRISAESADQTVYILQNTVDVPTLLPLTDLYRDPESGMRGYFLPRNDPRGLQLGVLTGCCQHLDAAGEPCAIAGQSEPSSGFFVVEDDGGKIVAQSWMWASQDDAGHSGIIFDNIETLNLNDTRKIAVRQVYDQAAAALTAKFERVLVGNHNDIDTSDLVPAMHNLDPRKIGYKGMRDSHSQSVWKPRLAGDLEKEVQPEAGARFEGQKDGFKIVSGTDTVTVNRRGEILLEGAEAETLAQRELTKMTTRNYPIVTVNGTLTGESITIEAGVSHGWEIDVDGLTAYRSALTDRAKTLTDGGIEKGSQRTWLELAGGDADKAVKLHATGWGETNVRKLLQANRPDIALNPMPPMLTQFGKDAAGNLGLTSAEYVNAVVTGKQRVADMMLADGAWINALPTINGNGSGEARRFCDLVQQWDQRKRVMLNDMSEVIPLLQARPEIYDIALTAKIGALLRESGSTGGKTTALHALTIIDDLNMKGMTTKDIDTLADMSANMLENRQKQPAPLLVRSERKMWASWTTEQREQAIKTLEISKTYPRNSAELHQLSNRNLTKEQPLRGMRMLDAYEKTDSGKGKSYNRTAKILAAPYKRIIKHLDPNAETPTETQLIQMLDISMETVEKFANMSYRYYTGGLRTNAYCTPEDLITLGTTTRVRQQEVQHILNIMGVPVKNAAGVAALVRSGITLTDIVSKSTLTGMTADPHADTSRAHAKVLQEVPSGLQTGLSRKEVRKIVLSGADARIKRLLLHNPIARTAHKNKIPSDCLNRIAKLNDHWVHNTSDDADPTIDWLLRYASRGKAEAKRVTQGIVVGMSHNDILKNTVAPEDVPAILGGLRKPFSVRNACD